MQGFLTIAGLDRPAESARPALVWDPARARFVATLLTGALLTGLTPQRLVYGAADGSATQSAALTWDGTTFAVTGAATVSTTLTATGVLKTLSTTDASDSANAALVSTGGVAMAKNLWIGADALAGVAATLNCAAANGGFFKFTVAQVLRWQFGRTGTTHDFQLSGYDSGGSLTDVPLTIANAAGGAFTIVRPVTLSTASGGLTIAKTTGETLTVSSTATTCASFAGGVLLSKATGTTLTVSSTDASTTTLTGCALFAGGVGIAGRLNVGGQSKFGSATVAADFTTTDAGTTNQPSVFTINHATSGTPAAGFGCDFDLNAHSDNNTLRNQGSVITQWATATDASRKARRSFFVADTGFREGFRVEASGSAPMIGFLGANATARTAVTGSRGGNAALAALLTELATKGLITDSTTA